ncbi:chemotaxis protein CheA [Sphingobium boeckii]|uniref:Chemotaxis protein CheA n=1 Tax=Sphingobium boeckii TaxID=1082345 RepID=A0A7W9EGJ2_9SPHN|nr:chemotaxis protein CheA [Sphingobium boeckii]MBB5687155.1 two-component system chemotaxis sensor kinase CheA [Sphingobium boeckii]
MDEILQEFIAETRETLEAVAGELVAWEANPEDRNRLDTIFRFVHTVKGSCGFLDLPRLERLSHAAEEALSEARDGKRRANSAMVSAVLAVIDRIGELTEALDTGEAVPDGGDERLIAALRVDAIMPDGAVPAAAAAKGNIRSIRISLDLLDRMMNGVSDLVLSRNEVSRRLQESEADPALGGAFDRLSACVADMRDAITRTRMQRIEKLFSSVPRLVRDVAGDLGKLVDLEIDGGDVELDREMIEMIRDPLTHIIRNALDHGIELPDIREIAGKPRAGRLRITARQSGNQILIGVSDDGRGIDPARLMEKAIAAGVVSAERAARLSPEARLALIFEPGLSTADGVTQLSGRGVGMDVVRSNIETIGGVVEIDSQPGRGLTLNMRVPLTLTIIPALTVSVADQHFAIPRSAIQEIVRETSESVRIERIGSALIARIRDQRIPVVRLESVLGLDEGEGAAPRCLVVLNPAGGAVYAISVSAVHDHQELVIRPSCPAIMGTGVYAGMTLPDTGEPMLLLDPAGIAEKSGIAAIDIADEADNAPDPAQMHERVAMLLFRDLDGVERAVRVGVVERIEDVSGDQIRFAAGRLRLSIDDRIIPLVGFDKLTDRAAVTVLRLNDGTVELAYAIDEVIDIVTLPPVIERAARPGVIEGVALIDGRQVELLDPYWLFSEAMDISTAGPATARPLCLLPAGDDHWTREVLRPLVEAAGYRVAFAGDVSPEDADFVIASDDAPSALPAGSGKLLTLRKDLGNRDADPASVYRYDRAGLMSALQINRTRAKG